MKINVSNTLRAIEIYYADLGRKYKPIDNGNDAVLYYHMNHDMYYNQLVSEIKYSREGRNFLRWVLSKTTFPKQLRKIIKKQLAIEEEY